MNWLRGGIMSAFPALALAIAMTYLVGDLYRPFVPQLVSYMLDLVLAAGVFMVANRVLKELKE
jgi:hypothetical protein